MFTIAVDPLLAKKEYDLNDVYDGICELWNYTWKWVVPHFQQQNAI